MGYSTYFTGELTFNKEVTEELKNYINQFARVRHMRRNNEKIKEIFPDWKDKCFNGNLGNDGEYFVGGTGFAGQDKDDSILNYNYPARGVPGLWCDWEIMEYSNGEQVLCWNEKEKFYDYTEWLEYLIKNFFMPHGYILNGTIEYQGENSDDFGKIVVTDNYVEVLEGIHAMDLSELDDRELIDELKSRGYTIVA